MCIVSLDSNADTKIYDAHGEILIKSSTEEVHAWKENQATESEANVCPLDLEVTSSKLFRVSTLLYILHSKFLFDSILQETHCL